MSPSAMNTSNSNKWLFLASAVAGAAVWGVFEALKTEPWDEPYGWLVLPAIGIGFGFLGKERPMLWPCGIFLGEIVFGTASFAKSLFFYSGGGGQSFFPLGVLFLVPFTLPAFLGSFIGSLLRKAFSAGAQK